MQKLSPICKIIAHPPGKGRMWENPPAYKITPYSLTIRVHRKGGSVHPRQRESLMYLTEGLPEGPKRRGKQQPYMPSLRGAQGLHGNRCHTPEWSHTKTVPA